MKKKKSLDKKWQRTAKIQKIENDVQKWVNDSLINNFKTILNYDMNITDESFEKFKIYETGTL